MTNPEAFNLLTQQHNVPDELFNLEESIIVANQFLEEVNVFEVYDWEQLLDLYISWLEKKLGF